MAQRRHGLMAFLVIAALVAACGAESTGTTDTREPGDTSGGLLSDSPMTDSGWPVCDGEDPSCPPGPPDLTDAPPGPDIDDSVGDDAIVDVADLLPDVLPDVPPDLTLDLSPDLPEVILAPPCGPAPYEGPVAELWDMPILADPSTLDVEVVATWTEGFPPIQISEIRYTSYEVENCVYHPIRLEAYVAMPLFAVGTDGTLPGIVKVHGLGGNADPAAAATPARELGVAVLAYSGPGQGLSEGTGSTPDHLFDTIPEPRASWFWEHAVAGIRGLTVLETLQEVDPARLGMTGYSGGSVATLMVNGVDTRMKAAVSVSASGHLDLAAAATPVPGWEANLLAAMTEPKTPASPEFQAYVQYLDPKNYLATASGETLLINGAQDEFFPINSFTFTFDDLGGATAGHRMLVIKDWDHGPLAMLYGTEAAEAMSVATLGVWFRRVFGLDAAVAELPPMPVVTIEPWTCFDPDTWLVWDCALAGVTFSGPTGYYVQEAKLHWSADGSLTYFSWNLQDQGGGIWAAEVGILDGKAAGDMVYFAEVKFAASGFFGPEFWLTSRPHVPDGFVPNIIPMP